MRQAIRKFLLIYILFAAVFILMKPVFMLIYSDRIQTSLQDFLAVIWHGLAMDFSVAGYFTIIPGLLISLSLVPWKSFPAIASRAERSCGGGGSLADKLLGYYMIIAAAIIAFLFTLDFGLYDSWGFRLDATPFFYIFTSPRSAMASLEWWHYPLALLSMTAIFLFIYLPYRHWIATKTTSGFSRKPFYPLIMLLLTGALFLPIRGSVTVSTMNPSRAYFSTDQTLNHAALNPLFTLLYSLSHQTNFASQYNFMSDEEAASTLRELLIDNTAATEPSLPVIEEQPSQVVLIILESFSAHLLPSLGGENIAPGLDSLAREGASFTNFYASSFRTDRGLAAILSSFPAPTNTSLLKYVEKFETLPSLPGELKRQGGYNLSYYYGGDANFTNMQAYLVSMGFDHIVSDRDFPLSERSSKWGAHDDVLLRRALSNLSAPTSQPSFSVIQTSSSHEPFEVPYRSPLFPSDSEDDKRRNAFAYTDSCLFSFIDSLRSLPTWDNTLVIITADHYGCYPQNLTSAPERHHIPLILLGGKLPSLDARANAPAALNKLSMQTDIGATILALLGYDHSRLKYSRNILAPQTAPAAIFTEPSLVGIVTPSDTIVYNPDADAIVYSSGVNPAGNAPLLPAAKAFLRNLYATLDSLGRQ